jgi:hypothetical protein
MGTPATARAAVIGHILTWFFAAVVALGLLAVSAPVAAAAKSSHSSKSSKSSQAKALAAYQSCLAKHGVKLTSHGRGHFPHGTFNGTPPSGGFPGAGSGGGFPGAGSGGGFPPGGSGSGSSSFRNSKFAKAMAACKSKLPKGFKRGAGGGAPTTLTPAQQQALATFRQCLESHGMNISSTSSLQTILSLLRADPSASSACRSDLNALFPQRPSGSGSSGSTT